MSRPNSLLPSLSLRDASSGGSHSDDEEEEEDDGNAAERGHLRGRGRGGGGGEGEGSDTALLNALRMQKILTGVSGGLFLLVLLLAGALLRYPTDSAAAVAAAEAAAEAKTAAAAVTAVVASCASSASSSASASASSPSPSPVDPTALPDASSHPALREFATPRVPFLLEDESRTDWPSSLVSLTDPLAPPVRVTPPEWLSAASSSVVGWERRHRNILSNIRRYVCAEKKRVGNNGEGSFLYWVSAALPELDSNTRVLARYVQALTAADEPGRIALARALPRSEVAPLPLPGPFLPTYGDSATVVGEVAVVSFWDAGPGRPFGVNSQQLHSLIVNRRYNNRVALITRIKLLDAGQKSQLLKHGVELVDIEALDPLCPQCAEFTKLYPITNEYDQLACYTRWFYLAAWLGAPVPAPDAAADGLPPPPPPPRPPPKAVFYADGDATVFANVTTLYHFMRDRDGTEGALCHAYDGGNAALSFWSRSLLEEFNDMTLHLYRKGVWPGKPRIGYHNDMAVLSYYHAQKTGWEPCPSLVRPFWDDKQLPNYFQSSQELRQAGLFGSLCGPRFQSEVDQRYAAAFEGNFGQPTAYWLGEGDAATEWRRVPRGPLYLHKGRVFVQYRLLHEPVQLLGTHSKDTGGIQQVADFLQTMETDSDKWYEIPGWTTNDMKESSGPQIN